MSSFAENFRDHVTPRLRKMCAAHGLFVAAGLQSWCEATSEVIYYARKLGASHLPEALHDELVCNWIPNQLLGAAIDAECAVEESIRLGDHIADQTARHFREFHDLAAG